MRYRWPRRVLPLIGAALCASCGAVASSPPPADGCSALALAPYTPEEQVAVADELVAARADAVWPGWIADYGRLRAGVRACQAVR